ncbi:hypothetical protein RvY_04446-2 [Ramazzottius varieornatus]|uniref:Uncharacterized protein n=1 Tax=Ramazzottius varieornatus TaxID=947166 RepID=A0A1D1URQ0_RAMVA|nr:hypothetical protein RvY_04446-2 [Ramazzottius varieornatus]
MENTEKITAGEHPPPYHQQQIPTGPPQPHSYPGYGTGYQQTTYPHGYHHPAQDYAPVSHGYAPAPHGYAPPPQGYASHPMSYPHPPHACAPAQNQATSSVNVHIAQGAGQSQHTVILQKRGVNHCLHFIITLFIPPWIFVWIFCEY